MKHATRALFALLAIVSATSCADEGFPSPAGAMTSDDGGVSGADVSDTSMGGSDAGGDVSSDGGSSPDGSGSVDEACRQSRAQGLPARLVAMSTQASSGSQLVYVSDLFNRFASICGQCHGPAVDPPGLGGFQIKNAHDFQTVMTPAVLAHIESDGYSTDPPMPGDPKEPMPPLGTPLGGPFSKRSPSDPVYQLAKLVELWLAAGSPQAFPLPDSQDQDAGTGHFVMTPTSGNGMTNIGNCVPSKVIFGIEKDKGAALDDKFEKLVSLPPGPGVSGAQLLGLPARLSETDLFTLDSEVLAQTGVVAFQPAYPLWSDNAGKLRHVRVPRGKTIRFDKATQQFDIPPNTRFYKTFMKQIIDSDGSYRFKKVETRLVVARPDTVNPDGTRTPTALFGTYQWNPDETDAALVVTPLKNGLPFADTLLQYTTDEQLAQVLLSVQPADPLEALLEGGAARHYAIPSSERCIQCHMGSVSSSFVLGFRPVQIKRFPAGQHGILIEPDQMPPGPDELDQLQRFIDYGVVSGIDSLDDVLPLEQLEGDRKPRNDAELTAQGYMLGNCAHCHNPNGFPSVKAPVLADTFNLNPSVIGGIFQFPLDKFSPRITRGPGGSESIPYITPSIMDLPPAEWNAQGSAPHYVVGVYTPKYSVSDKAGADYILFAPWRSLIYRNVSTPFPYTDDLALFPHMPMNTAGFDRRAHQIMADWMVSIPAKRKHPEIPEFGVVSIGGTFAGADTPDGGVALDDDPQPYLEVKPGSADYEQAQRDVEARLNFFHNGFMLSGKYSVYQSCPDTSDILDPAVVRDPVCRVAPTPATRVGDSASLYNVVPDHAHWVVTDLTQVPGDWSPRRADWATVLAKQQFPLPQAACSVSKDQATAAQNEIKGTVSLLQNVELDDAIRSFATKDLAFGIWNRKPECTFNSVPKASSFDGADRPLWFDDKQVAPDDPVYTQWPGAAIFGMICINCHGPEADGHGRMADNLALITGGTAVVANLRDGLFGPVGAPGANRKHGFDDLLPSDAPQAWKDLTIDDRAARYLPWMAMGGTEVQIPNAILQIVADTEVFGVKRTLPPEAISANMLSAARVICRSLLVPDVGSSVRFTWKNGWFEPSARDPNYLASFPHLIASNGDAELWLRLCSVNNPPPVRALLAFNLDPSEALVLAPTSGTLGDDRDLFDASVYGDGAVGNEHGGVDPSGVQAGNLFPWCIRMPGATEAMYSQVQAFVQQNNLPACPFPTAGAHGYNAHSADCTVDGCWAAKSGAVSKVDQWAARGAINAGLSVFLYLDGIAKGQTQRKPTYDHCEQLN